MSKYVTFLVENCLYTAVLWASVHAIDFYLTIVKLPALIIMLVDSFMATLLVHAIVVFAVISNSKSSNTGEFLSNHCAELSRGYAVVCSVLWACMLLCTTSIHVPFIAAVPGGTTASSLLSVAVVLGFGAIVPFLSILSTFVATPAGLYTSIVNGTSISAACLVFFVLLSLGSVGTTKCSLVGSANSFAFYTLVCIYWAAIVLVEMVIFFKWDPVSMMFNLFKGHPSSTPSSTPSGEHRGEAVVQINTVSPNQHSETLTARIVAAFRDFSRLFPVSNVWRLVSGAVDFVIVWSTLGFCASDVTWAVELALLLVVALHVPMVITPDFERIGRWWRHRHPTNNKTATMASVSITEMPNPQRHFYATAPGAATTTTPEGGGTVACFPPPFSQHTAINSRVLTTLPRHRRGLEAAPLARGGDVFY